jgi:hypothetical protein
MKAERRRAYDIDDAYADDDVDPFDRPRPVPRGARSPSGISMLRACFDGRQSTTRRREASSSRRRATSSLRRRSPTARGSTNA